MVRGASKLEPQLFTGFLGMDDVLNDKSTVSKLFCGVLVVVTARISGHGCELLARASERAGK